MENSGTRLLVNLGLFAIALGLMSISNQWLFFLGLALMLLSGVFSVQRPSRGTWPGWLAVAVLGGVVGFLLWLSSCGREPLDLITACAAALGVVVTEVGYWRASRNASENA